MYKRFNVLLYANATKVCFCYSHESHTVRKSVLDSALYCVNKSVGLLHLTSVGMEFKCDFLSTEKPTYWPAIHKEVPGCH